MKMTLCKNLVELFTLVTCYILLCHALPKDYDPFKRAVNRQYIGFEQGRLKITLSFRGLFNAWILSESFQHSIIINKCNIIFPVMK